MIFSSFVGMRQTRMDLFLESRWAFGVREGAFMGQLQQRVIRV